MLNNEEKFRLNHMNRTCYEMKLGDKLQGQAVGTLSKGLDTGADVVEQESVFYVSAATGSDSNDGLTWDTAFATIDKGVDTARYVPGTTSIAGDSPYNAVGYKNRQKYVYVAPGQYNEQLLFSGYNISVIGTMPIDQQNGDWGVIINKDEAVTTTCVVGFTGAGIELCNLWIVNRSAIPTLWVPTPGDGCIVHNCVLDGDDTATKGIDWSDMRNSTIENCKVFGHATAGIEIGDNGKWMRQSKVNNNYIATAATSGIIVVAGTIASSDEQASMIAHNYVLGSPTVGIHIDSAGAAIAAIDNWTSIDCTTDVTNDGGDNIDNHVGA